MTQRIERSFRTTLTCALIFFCGTVWAAPEHEEALKALEKKFTKIEKKSKKRSKSIGNKFDKYLQRLKINGFASAGLSTSDVDPEFVTGINDTKNNQSEAVIALQANFQINEKTEAVLQLASRGIERNNTEAEWAYVAHSFTPNFTMRAGRLRVPYYVSSEYIEVGYAYPWARPPIDIYNQAPFTSYYGVDSFISFDFLGAEHTLQVFNGTDFLQLEVADFYINLMYGAYLNSSKGPWGLRIGRTNVEGTLEGELTLDAPASVIASSGFSQFKENIPSLIASFDLSSLTAEQLAEFGSIDLNNDADLFPLYLVNALYDANRSDFNDNGSNNFTQDGYFNASDTLAMAFDLDGIQIKFDNFGLSYDDGNWLMLLEFTRLAFSGDFQTVYAHYATFGKRFNKVLPYLLYSHAYTPDDGVFAKSIGHLLPDVVNGLGFSIVKQKTYSAGVRWDAGQSFAIKFQYDHITDMEGTNGKFSSNPGSDADLFTFVVDVVF